ncbi:MAG: glycosyltransferase [Acidobacteria bacterium]|nr:glycosyltransferase [Acidobacteriota bacterium]
MSHFLPFPPRGGAHQRSFNLLRQIGRSHQVSLVALNRLWQSPDQLECARREFSLFCAEVSFWDPPFPWRGTRWWGRLALSPFDRYPYGSRATWCPKLAAAWKSILQRLQPDLVHFDASDVGMFIPAASDFRKVLNHHNCESAMAFRRARNELNPVRKAYLWHQARKLRRLEAQVCHQCHVNLAVSELDAQLIRSVDPQAHVHLVENGTDTAYFTPTPLEGEAHSLIFAGSLRWYPNISAVSYLVREIWPLIKHQEPAARLYVAGQFPSEKMVGWLKGHRDIEVVASPEDIRPWVARAAVFVCPVLDGGGTRIKILDAMAMGKAVVSTSIGCEGLAVKHGENILIGDSPAEFADEVVRTLRSPFLRKHIENNGRSLVEKRYSWEVVGARLEQAYECALDRGACAERL